MTRVKNKNPSHNKGIDTSSDTKNIVTPIKGKLSENGDKVKDGNGKNKKSKKKSLETGSNPASASRTGIRSNNGSTLKKTKNSDSLTTTKQETQPTVPAKQKSKPTRKDSPVKKIEKKLRPSDIRYSQSSISSQFKDGTNIGQLLDDIFFGRCFASALPQIEVSYIKGQWVSADNRRLWVFKQLEILDKVDVITVRVSKSIYCGKLTSENAGVDVEIRNGKPEGTVYSLINVGQNLDMENDSVKGATDQVTKSGRKRRNRRRRRKPRASDESVSINKHVDSGIEQNNHQSKPEIDNLDQLETAPTYSDTCQHDSPSELETLLRYNQDLVDESTYYEEFIYYDSDDWTDTDLSDTVSPSENIFSVAKADNYWGEWEEDVNNYFESVKNIYGEAHTDKECISDDSDFSEMFDYFPWTNSQELATNIRHYDSNFNVADRHFENTREVQIASYQSNIEQMPAQNDVATSFDVETRDHSWDICQNEPDINTWGVDCYCGQYDCVRCTQMPFYREMDKGHYNYRSSQHSVVIGSTADSKPAEKKSVLSKLSRGVDSVIGFFNKIFS